MADFLANKEMLNHRKKELLHKKWTENVNEPIRREVDTEMNGPNYFELVRRKRELYKEYLEHTNRKVMHAVQYLMYCVMSVFIHLLFSCGSCQPGSLSRCKNTSK